MRDEDLREEFAAWLRPVRDASPPELPVIRRRLRRRRTRQAIGGSAALAAVAGIAVAVSTTLGAPSTPAGPPGPTNAPRLPSNIPVTTTGPHPAHGGHEVISSYTVSSAVSTLQVNEGTGSITVTGSRRSTISVSERVWYSGRPAAMVRNLTGKTMTLQEWECSGPCIVSYDIQVPRGLDVDVQTQGNIRLSSLAGNVAALSLLGPIVADGLSSREAGFVSNNGNITATFTAPPMMVHASGSGGNVTVRVPGTVSYRVEIPAWSDRRSTIGVRQSSRSRHVIVAGSNQGTEVIVPSP